MQINRINANQPSFGAIVYDTRAARNLGKYLYHNFPKTMDKNLRIKKVKDLPEVGIVKYDKNRKSKGAGFRSGAFLLYIPDTS